MFRVYVKDIYELITPLVVFSCLGYNFTALLILAFDVLNHPSTRLNEINILDSLTSTSGL